MKRALLFTMLALLVVSGMALAQEKTEIIFWHAMSGQREDIIQRMVDDFNIINPDIEVFVEYKGSYRDTLNAAQAAARAGNAPHVIQSFEIATQQLIDMGIFANAEDLIDRFGTVIPWDDYIAPALNYYKIDGRQVSFPWNSSNAILYYNKTLFDAAGVTIPVKPTFEDIIEVGRALIAAGVVNEAITWPTHSWFFEQWMANLGAELVNNGNGRAGMATEINLLAPEAIEIMTWWKQLFDEGIWVNPGRENWAQARQNFTTQRVAMLISSTSDVNRMETAAFEGGWEVLTTFMPIPEGSVRHGAVIGGGSLWVTADQSEAELEAAVRFVVYLSQVSQDIEWHQGTGYFAFRHTSILALEQEGWYEIHPNFKTAADQLAETLLVPATQGALMGVFPEARTFIVDAVEAFLLGTPIEEALAAAKARIDQSLVDYKELIGG